MELRIELPPPRPEVRQERRGGQFHSKGRGQDQWHQDAWWKEEGGDGAAAWPSAPPAAAPYGANSWSIANWGAASGAKRAYRAVAKLGGGSFGDILAAVNIADPEDWVALKVEPRYRANDLERRTVEYGTVAFGHFEWLVYCDIRRGLRGRACPCPEARGYKNLYDEHDVLAMELCAQNLRDYADALGQWPMQEDMVLIIGAVLVDRLQQLHASGFVHRDLKPENVELRLDASADEGPVPCFLLVDFALAARFSRPGAGGHVERRDAPETRIAGTHRYMAIDTQQGCPHTRRSDLESLAYVLIYLALGKLPWQHLQDCQDMLLCKRQASVTDICSGLRSAALSSFLHRCRGQPADEAPPYAALQRTLLEGATGAVDFNVERIRQQFKNNLKEADLRAQDAASLACPPPGGGGPALSLGASPAVHVFVCRDPEGDATRVLPWQQARVEELEDSWCFFFEAFTEPLPGTAHVVVGPRHFFGFLHKEGALEAERERPPKDPKQSECCICEQRWGAEQVRRARCGHPMHDACLAALLLGPGACPVCSRQLGAQALMDAERVEQILVLSNGGRDWVIRACTLPEYDPTTGQVHKGWNLRSAFWSWVVLPRAPTSPAGQPT